MLQNVSVWQDYIKHHHLGATTPIQVHTYYICTSGYPETSHSKAWTENGANSCGENSSTYIQVCIFILFSSCLLPSRRRREKKRPLPKICADGSRINVFAAHVDQRRAVWPLAAGPPSVAHRTAQCGRNMRFADGMSETQHG